MPIVGNKYFFAILIIIQNIPYIFLIDIKFNYLHVLILIPDGTLRIVY